MTLEIRKLSAVEDVALYEEAFNWLNESPLWRKETVAAFSTLEHDEYVRNTHDVGRVDVGVFDSGEFIAIVSNLIRGPGIWETNFEAKRGANIDVIFEACEWIRDYMFGMYGCVLAYTITPKFNRPIIAMDKKLGFVDNKMRYFHGAIKDHPICWVYLELTLERWLNIPILKAA